MDPFIAEIRIFPFDFAPTGWAACDGRLLAISQNQALFSLLGTTYGGDGRTNFALPDLRGRAPMHPGQGPGLSARELGGSLGAEQVTLSEAELPIHSHGLRANTDRPADTTLPSPAASFAASTGGTLYQASPNTRLAATAVAASGGDAAHENLQPYLTLNFNIALQGIYPPRP